MRHHPSRFRAVVVAAAALSVAMIALKLFTTEVRFADDPTVQLALRGRPSLASKILVHDDRESRTLHVILSDENAFVGQSIYRMITSFGWLIGCAVLAGYSVYAAAGRRAPDR